MIARVEVAAERGAHDLLAMRLGADDVDDHLAARLRQLRLRALPAVGRHGDVVIGSDAHIADRLAHSGRYCGDLPVSRFALGKLGRRRHWLSEQHDRRERCRRTELQLHRELLRSKARK